MSFNYFTAHIDYISSFFKLSLQEIKDKLVHHPVYLVEYIEGDKYKKFIEAPLRIAKTYLICYFDENDICDYIILRPDNKHDAKIFISYCTCEYDFLKAHWLLNDCFVAIKECNDSCIFCFYG